MAEEKFNSQLHLFILMFLFLDHEPVSCMKCGIQDFSEKFKTSGRTSIQCCIDTLEKIEAARKNYGKTSGKTSQITSLPPAFLYFKLSRT